jgi:heme/copper-type cytochrome/quinol oxidase subunit 2
MDLPSFFFAEVWAHRRNRFIAVGGTALFLLFLTLALANVPWVPDSLKLTLWIFCGISIFTTLLLMIYYAVKFVVVAVVWLFRRAFGLSSREDHISLDQRNSPK